MNVPRDGFFQRDKDNIVPRGQANQAVEARGYLYRGEGRRVVVLAFQQKAQVERAVVNQREGTGRVHGHGREHGIDVRLKIRIQIGGLHAGKVILIDEAHAGFRQFGQDLFAQHIVHGAHHHAHARGDGGNLLLRAHACRVCAGVARVDLIPDGSDADHKEFIEVRARDGEEFHPFKNGVSRGNGFVDYALVEFQPAQFAADKVFWRIAFGTHGNAPSVPRFCFLYYTRKVRWKQPVFAGFNLNLICIIYFVLDESKGFC